MPEIRNWKWSNTMSNHKTNSPKSLKKKSRKKENNE